MTMNWLGSSPSPSKDRNKGIFMRLSKLIANYDTFFGVRLALATCTATSLYAIIEGIPMVLAADSTTSMVSAAALIVLGSYTLSGSLLEGYRWGNRIDCINLKELKALRETDELTLMCATSHSILTGPYECLVG